jgi:DNA invertase Pin-like site-specific DNA recombinase
MLSVEARRKKARLVLRLLAQGMTRTEAARAAKISRPELYRVLAKAGQLASAGMG